MVCIRACVVKHGLQVRGGLHRGVRGQTWAAGAWKFALGRAWSNMGCRCVVVCIEAYMCQFTLGMRLTVNIWEVAGFGLDIAGMSPGEFQIISKRAACSRASCSAV